ncbi:SusC/RagA family TonB-linked outer membrane protein [Mucilaginibacter sp. UR6-11]|uniref:SusC/RagA family TonB-linked outer membrane protein n=1 Tax=Mucilaginibacter sp. UR6-11 TaxID=1435644 RepID=UPI001E332B3E|nr:SusC/RagA family TonB-linked outer membrane protein [Mucilaginibacter sp. UR6-11]MCC8426486.1 SusC/RagA family TonB-linked outer membrane protein [Mucilaginibacter sp. UR6-11]
MKLIFLCRSVFFSEATKRKTYVVMKLTTILLLIGALQLSAAGFAQTVTISRHNASLETLFKDIKKQTGYTFFYTGKINVRQTQDVDLKNATIAEAMRTCLQQLALDFTIVDKTVVISPAKPAKAEKPVPVSVIAAPLIIQGKIIDSASREPLIGVNISVKNKPIHVQTNANGDFGLAANAGDVLVISYIGYNTKEITVIDNKPLVIQLSIRSNHVNDVVVTGYQVIKRDNYTGSAVTISGDDLRRVNPQSVIKSIATFDPSFRIADNNILGSNPNALPKITVRGSTTLPSVNGAIINRNDLSSSYNQPVFILDGFEVSLEKVVDMDINRIASINILKDAAATAVYGSKAANGVIVITTRAPAPGKLQLTYNSELRVQAPDLTGYHVLNASDKLQYEKLAGLYSTVNNTANSQDQLDQEYYSKLRNVVSGVNSYWLSQPLQNAYGMKHSIYAEGGDTTFRYGIDLRYETSPGVMKGSGRDRYTGGMSFFYNPTRSLLVKNEVTVSQIKSRNSEYGDFSTYVSMNPYYPIRDANGNYIREIANWRVDTHAKGPDQIKNEPVYNPLFESTLGSFDRSAYLEFQDNFSADWKILPGLRLIGLFSVINTKSTSDKFVSPLSNSFYFGPTSDIQNRGSYDYSADNLLTLNGNIKLVYNKQLGDHSINAVLNSQVYTSNEDYKGFQARGFSNDRFTNIGFARTYTPNSSPDGNVYTTRTISQFFTANYAYRNKYLLDATLSANGSSAFGANQRIAPFWAGGIGWNAHYEDFIKNNLSSVSRLKLTFTTGLTGSVNFPPSLANTTYNYQSDWYSTGVGAVVNAYGNQDLKWQKTTNYDYSLELGLFKDRVVINPHYYYKLTKGLVNSVNIAPSTGFATYDANLGDMSNKGYELYVTVNAYRTQDVNINFIGNLAHNKNTIVKISNALKAYNDAVNNYQSNADNKAQGIPLLHYQEGQSLYTIWGVKSMGIDPENGKEILVKRDGSLTYDWNAVDEQPIGNMEPKAEGFVGSNITFKQFLLSFQFHYKFGGQVFNQTLIDRVENADPRFNVDSRVLTERWQKPGDKALYKNVADLGTSYATSRFVQRENTIDLPSVTLSYEVKKTFAKKIGMHSLRATLTVNDAFYSSTIQQERGIQYPYARSLTGSIQATF